MSSFIVKFCYNQAIKKVQITKGELNWENVCSILMKSFYLADKSKIQLKYKDLENDEITVSSDDDLAEAFNIYFMKNLVKFFVYYSGVFSQENQGQNTGYSKIPRLKSLNAIPEEPKAKIPSDNENSQKNEKISVPADTEAENSVKPKLTKVKIDPQELQTIFSEVFSTSEVLKKIQDKLRGYISKEDKDTSEIVEYSIDTDYQAIADYIMASFSDIMNQKVQEHPVEDSSIINNKSQKQEEERKIEPRKAEKSLLDVSLRESIYENSTSQGPYTVSLKEKDPKMSSFNSSIECRDLGSQLGVKLVLKYEDGKAKFVSIPAFEYSIIEAKPNTDSVKEEVKEEQVDEAVGGIVLSLKKKASMERRGVEFKNNMLKTNLHDLDDDLPAPYDRKLVQKYEKGIQDSVYEKID